MIFWFIVQTCRSILFISKLYWKYYKIKKFFAKLSKCSFTTAEVSYLGHIIFAQGVHPDPDKVRAIHKWPQPRSLTELRGFFGLIGFYRKFIKQYATLAAPLTDLLQHHKITWSQLAQQAFENLKLHIAKVSTLHLPDFKLPFVVETDASAVAVGIVLSQSGRLLAFFSKKRWVSNSKLPQCMYARCTPLQNP